jgi:nucleotide-binding universal stress UspA family protein
MAGYRIILVPHDFSGHSAAALDTARDLAKRLGSELHVMHVILPPMVAYIPPVVPAAGLPEELRAAAERSLAEVVESLDFPAARVEIHVATHSGIAGAIVEAAKKVGADLIVMGTHGRSGLAHAFLGSVTERTLRRAPCPVLTVRAEEAA